MKKILAVLFVLSLAIGCGCVKMKASDAVSEYLGKYTNQQAEVMGELTHLIEEENLSEKQAKLYEEAMRKQYKDLKYEIIEETYNGEEATVKTQISVYDFYKTQKEADEYKNNHKEEFQGENSAYDANKFLDYKLEQMKKETTKVEYTIFFQVIKKEGKWVLETVKTEDLEKIHGIYNYQND